MWVAIFMAILTFVVPRKYFLLPYVLAACFVPADQRIIIMDLDFTVLRILIVFGVLRILVRNEQVAIRWNRFDKMVLAWAFCGAVVYVLQWSDMKALINRSGFLFDIIGLYWLSRQRIRSWSDIKLFVAFLAFSALILAPLVALEWSTGQNPFEVLGRVHTAVREGRYRCQASFPHSIMLGLFWATLVPLFVGLGISYKKKILYWVTATVSVFIVCATASSTPLFTLIAVAILLVLFRYRCYGRQIVWALCGLTIALHLVMKAPVWHLISRVNIVGGSTGWHRYHLIDQAAEHFGEWVLIGTRSTTHWGWNLGDITNQYVLEGVRGGLGTLVLFIALLVWAVKIVGGYSLCCVQVKQQWLAWAICVSILGHCISFIGVSYFGQIEMLLYFMFALVALIYELSFKPVPTVRPAKLLA